MRILLWHVHGAWTTAFVHGRHQYLIPVTPDRGPDGLGRARTYTWPPSAVEVTREQAAAADADVVVLQRPHELGWLAADWLGGRRPGLVAATLAVGRSSAVAEERTATERSSPYSVAIRR